MVQSPRQFSTQGIVLRRTDFNEADRILTFLTPDQGKVRAIAKSVRKASAKLAGAIELFSVTDIIIVGGRGEISTLTSARLARHYANIAKDLERTQRGYEFLGMIDKATEQRPEPDYFDLLDKALAALDAKIDGQLIDIWFKIQLLRLAGHSPNLRSDGLGKKLAKSKSYIFDYDKMRFTPNKSGEYNSNHIKFLRLAFSDNTPKTLQRINKVRHLVDDCQQLIETVLKTHIKI